ncbi:type II secretion system F family protein [Anaerocolumna aminovalerica]|uniref:type II secretion system F family protein n=1 Tax=Anaerocolumna aminovalerica TaxID=1527 RepID=UPI001596C4F3|nr:type II secretion system F family protein [Anaerocolumna aminovalerica]
MIEDYNVYVYSKKEWIKLFLQGGAIGFCIGILFYSSIIGAILLGSYGFIFVQNKKKQKIEERKWILNLQFKDGLSSVSAALNAGYSVENAFHQAVMDLKLMYPADAFIVQEFEGMVRQIKMNMTVEEVLMDFSIRSRIEDITNFAEVFVTAKRTGGDIVKIIRRTCKTIGDKVEVKREILTMITGKKFETSIMCLIPFCIILYLRLFSAGFLEPLYNNTFGAVFMTIVLTVYYFVYKLAHKIMKIEI